MKGKQNRSLVIAASLAAVILLALVAGCTTPEQSAPAGTQVPVVLPAVADVSAAPAATAVNPVAASLPASSGERQTIRISGSTTVLPIVQKAADQYMAMHANADIQVSGGGSGVGIQSVGAKTVDIGMSSREVTADEMKKYPSFVIIPVARDGIAVIVNPSNTIPYITLDQIRDIYLGKITKWTEISGASVPGTNNQIVVIGRDSASGTRSYFDESILAKKTPVKQMLEKNSNGAVLQTIAQTPGAIGYVSIGFVSADVKALPVWYNAERIVAPGLENVRDGSYPVSRELYVITNGQPSGLAGNFIQYMLGDDGQKIVAEEGYVTV